MATLADIVSKLSEISTITQGVSSKMDQVLIKLQVNAGGASEAELETVMTDLTTISGLLGDVNTKVESALNM